MPRPRPIAPPDDFSRDARALWHTLQRHLRAQETWQDTDAGLLEAYVRVVSLARSAREAAAGAPFVEGSKGQLVAHPGLRVAAEAERDACRYATALLLTPEARQRHDVKPPQAAEGELAFLTAV